LILPGSFFASAISSAMLFAGKLAEATTMCGISTSLVTPARSRDGRMVSWPGEDVLVDRVGRDVADQQRVAVRRGLRRGLEGDVAVRARPVLHDEALAERLGELRRDDARDDVGGAARPVGHQDPHRLCRVVLRAGGPAQGNKRQAKH
jgi:hypothetical protein